MRTKKLFSLRSIAIALCAVVLLGLFPNHALAWKFVVYGDTRSNVNDHKAVLQSIVANTPDYEFIMNVGDLVERGVRDYEWNDMWKSPVTEVLGTDGQTGSKRYYSCPGNHDDVELTGGLANWKNFLYGQCSDYPGPTGNGTYFYFDHNNIRFIVLDEERDYNQQEAMIIEAAMTNPNPWLFAVFHAQIFTYPDKLYDENLNIKFGKPLYEHGCDIIFMGDAHYYVKSKKLALDGTQTPDIDLENGTVHLVTGNSGANRDPIDNPNGDGFEWTIEGNYMTSQSQIGYTEIEIVSDQLLHMKHILHNGSVLDSKSYTPNLKPCSNCNKVKTSVNGYGSVSPSVGWYGENTNATLTATAPEGWVFSGWSGDESGTANPLSVPMSSDKNITANFSLLPGGTEVTLSPSDDAWVKSNAANENLGSATVLKANLGNKLAYLKFDLSSVSNVVSAKLEITSQNSGTIYLRQVHDDSWDESTITWNNKPVGDALVGVYNFSPAGTRSVDVTQYVIQELNGNGVASFSLSNKDRTNLDMNSKEGNNGPKLILTTDGGSSTTYDLTTSATNGTISLDPSGGTYNAGTNVTLTAIPDAGYVFENWSGSISGTNNPKTITMNSNKNVVANFTESGSGGGDVTETFGPTDDSWVNSNSANANYGSRDAIKLRDAGKTGLIKFDLSTIGTVSSATLDITADVAGTVELWEVNNDAWNEGSVNWNTKPDKTEYIGSYTFTGAGTKSVVVTQYIEDEALNDDAISFALIETNNTLMFVDSKEGANGPALTVTHDDIPKTSVDAVASNIEMHPNPTTGLVNISINDDDLTNAIIKIYNRNGALIDETVVENKYSTIELNGEAGLYLIEVNYNGKVETMPIIKR